MKRALVINGSVRIGGNTDRLVARLVEGAKEAGTDITMHVLRNLHIHDCAGCYHCYRHDRCALKDDMQIVHEDIQRSDLLILASPLYYWGVTGLMKTFIDRLYLYYPRENARLIAGKKAIIVTPMHVNEMEHGKKYYESEIEPITMTYKLILGRLGIEIADMIFYSGLSAKGDADNNAGYIEHAFKLGEELTTRMK